MLYSAFISYSHALDGELGAALQSALHRFARRWYQIRAVRVFRDKTNLTLSPGLWGSIKKVLSESEYLILLASPEAATSKWVRQEVDFWLHERNNENERAFERILLVVTGGQIAWDDTSGDFDWRKTDCLPDNLRDVYSEEPKYIDLRWARTAERLSLKNPVFLDSIADLAAILHAKDKDTLVGEDIREHRKVKFLAWSGAITLSVLTAISAAAAVFAVMQKNAADVARSRAEEQRNVAIARSMAVEAQLLRQDRAHQLPQSVLLAVESYRRSPSADTYRELRSGLALLPHTVGRGRSPNATAQRDSPAGGSFEGRCRDVSRHAGVSSADGRYVASVAGDGTRVEVRRKEGNDLVYKGEVGAGCVYRLALSRDASHLAVYGLRERDRVWILDTATDARRQLIVPHWEVSALALSDGGEYLATGSPDTTVRVWDWHKGKEIALVRHSETVQRVVFSAAGEYFATSANDRTVRVWELSRSREVLRHSTEGLVSSLVFSVDGRQIDIATPGGVDRLQLVSPLEVKRFDHGINAGPFTMSYAQNGLHLMVLGSNRVLKVWHTESGRVVLDQTGVWAAEISPSGKELAIANESGAVQLLDLENGAVITTLPTPVVGRMKFLAFSGDGKALVVAGEPKAVLIWDPSVAKPPMSVPHDVEVWGAAFVAGNRRLLTLDSQGMFREWDLGSGTAARPAIPMMPPAYPAATSISPGGHYAATFNRRAKTLQVSEGGSGKRVASFAYEENTTSFAFSRDNRHIAVVSQRDPRFKEGNSVSVVDLRDSKEVAVITSLEHISRVAFSGDGRLLATVGYGQASLWLWRPDDLIAEACKRVGRNLTPEEWRKHVGNEPYRKTCPELVN